MSVFGKEQLVDMSDFVEALKTNTYWASAGELVVKELM